MSNTYEAPNSFNTRHSTLHARRVVSYDLSMPTAIPDLKWTFRLYSLNIWSIKFSNCIVMLVHSRAWICKSLYCVRQLTVVIDIIPGDRMDGQSWKSCLRTWWHYYPSDDRILGQGVMGLAGVQLTNCIHPRALDPIYTFFTHLGQPIPCQKVVLTVSIPQALFYCNFQLTSFTQLCSKVPDSLDLTFIIYL